MATVLEASAVNNVQNFISALSELFWTDTTGTQRLTLESAQRVDFQYDPSLSLLGRSLTAMFLSRRGLDITDILNSLNILDGKVAEQSFLEGRLVFQFITESLAIEADIAEPGKREVEQLLALLPQRIKIQSIIKTN